VSASIGYALAPDDATQPLRLLQLADHAMYAAKRGGRNHVMHCVGLD
jgi:GGDEF domain-containing protein